MKTAKGTLEEIYLDGSARIDCPPDLIPAPGQYLLAHEDQSSAPLPVPLFFSGSTPHGFRSAPPLPAEWRPRTSLIMRGPIGHGFVVPPAARKMALIAFDNFPSRLRGLIPIALRQNAEIVLISDHAVDDFPEIVEIQPLKAMQESILWADYTAMDVARENLDQLKEMFGKGIQASARGEAQVLVRAPMPCGALAECGVCVVRLHQEWRLACKDGPVFSLKERY